MPPKEDPKFIRLAAHTCHGIMVDVEGQSLFSLSGMEVKPFPDEEFQDQVRFVREKIRIGQIEEASEVEYTEQMEAAKRIKANHVRTLAERLQSDEADIQEGDVQTEVSRLQRKIVGRRQGKVVDEDDGLAPGELEAREEAALAAAKGQEASSRSKATAGKTE